MPFDASVTKILANELNNRLASARIEKIFQPSRDTFMFWIHPEHTPLQRLVIDVSTSHPHICISDTDLENPKVPPMMCMLFRKHLTGGRVISVEAPVFDRVIKITVSGRDALGFETVKIIYVELTGRYSNLIFCNGDNTVVTAVRTSDITSSELRPIYPGAVYSYPPLQEGKINPLCVTEENFQYKDGIPSERAVMNGYYGISPLVSREIFYRSGISGPYSAFCSVMDAVKEMKPMPTVTYDDKGNPLDFSFFDYSRGMGNVKHPESLLDAVADFYSEHAESDRMSHRYADIMHLLVNAKNRISSKIAKQTEELTECGKKDGYKERADLITSNIYRLKKGMTECELVNYYSENCENVTVELDSRLTPSQNAAKYYKLYNKCKNAEEILAVQLESAKKELEYILSVISSLENAENENDINDVRRELADGGYLKKSLANVPKKLPAAEPLHLMTTNGIEILCGKNNRQNEEVTFRLASKADIWFHVKDRPGSHVVLLCGDTEPDAVDYTEAAVVAATYSDASDGETVAVNYTRIKNVKKPPSSPPGFVTFSNNYSAYVRPDKNTIQRLLSNMKKTRN